MEVPSPSLSRCGRRGIIVRPLRVVASPRLVQAQREHLAQRFLQLGRIDVLTGHVLTEHDVIVVGPDRRMLDLSLHRALDVLNAQLLVELAGLVEGTDLRLPDFRQPLRALADQGAAEQDRPRLCPVHPVPPAVRDHAIRRGVLLLELVDLLVADAELVRVPVTQDRMARQRTANRVLPALVNQLPELETTYGLVVANVEVALALEAVVSVAAESLPPFPLRYRVHLRRLA